jgi:hypothetical protein
MNSTETSVKQNGKASGVGWQDVAATAVLLVAAISLVVESSARDLWADETLSWTTATLGGPYQIWRSLKLMPLSVDPPVYHWINHFLIGLLGASDLAIRLTSMAGLLISLWFVYIFARRAGDRTIGLLAMSIVMASGAFSYGYEARPYGLVLAAASGALLSWQQVARGRARVWSAICLTACLAFADSLHYYSVLIFLPLAAAEMVRTFRTHKIDWLPWCAMIAGNAVMLAFLPLIPATRAYQADLWRGVVSGDILSAYRTLLLPVRIWGLLIAVVAAAYLFMQFFLRRRGAFRSSAPARLQIGELTALIGFAIYPAIVFALSVSFTHTFAERYALPVILGVSILAAFAARLLVKSDAIVLVAALFLLCYVPYRAVRSVQNEELSGTKYLPALLREAAVFNRGQESLPIVTNNPLLFLDMVRYAPDDLRRRLMLLDTVAEATPAGRKTPDIITLAVRLGTPLPVITRRQLDALPSSFFFLCLMCRNAQDAARTLDCSTPPETAGVFRSRPAFVVQPLHHTLQAASGDNR